MQRKREEYLYFRSIIKETKYKLELTPKFILYFPVNDSSDSIYWSPMDDSPRSSLIQFRRIHLEKRIYSVKIIKEKVLIFLENKDIVVFDLQQNEIEFQIRIDNSECTVSKCFPYALIGGNNGLLVMNIPQPRVRRISTESVYAIERIEDSFIVSYQNYLSFEKINLEKGKRTIMFTIQYEEKVSYFSLPFILPLKNVVVLRIKDLFWG